MVKENLPYVVPVEMRSIQELATVRPAKVEDFAYVCTSWKNNYKGSPVAARIPPETYRSGHGRIIKRLTERSITLIANPNNDPDLIIGYLVYEPECLHYVYTKTSYRQMGVAGMLLAAIKPYKPIPRFSHLTMDMLKFFQPYLTRLYGVRPLFDPYQTESKEHS